MDEVIFTPYPCSLGTVTAHDGSSYIIATTDGRTIGIPANGVPSAEAVEADIADPPAPPAPSVEQVWAGKLAGFLTVNGLDLKANRSAKNDFTGMFTLLGGGIQAGAITGSTPVDIWDWHETKHTLPASDCLALLLAYGFEWQAMFNEFAP